MKFIIIAFYFISMMASLIIIFNSWVVIALNYSCNSIFNNSTSCIFIPFYLSHLMPSSSHFMACYCLLNKVMPNWFHFMHLSLHAFHYLVWLTSYFVGNKTCRGLGPNDAPIKQSQSMLGSFGWTKNNDAWQLTLQFDYENGHSVQPNNTCML